MLKIMSKIKSQKNLQPRIWLCSLSLLLNMGWGFPLAALENPRSLADLKPDPILPTALLQRSPSPLERITIRETAEQLDQDARQQLAANETDRAFDLWFRALNLQRVLGKNAEIIALGEVAEQAWEAGEKIELQAITQRLQTLEKDLKAQGNWLSPEAIVLGISYQQARDLSSANRLYGYQLAEAQRTNNLATISAVLTQLIQVQWGALNYPFAAQYTQQQLEILRSQPATRSGLLEERSLLQSLSFFYQQTEDYLSTVTILKEAISLTLDLGLDAEVAPLQVILAEAQILSGDSLAATDTYRQAYLKAQQQQQFYLAQDILFALGQLREQRGELAEAIQVYEILRQVHRYSSNLLGLLESYDRLGQLYLQINNPQLASEQFQKGLELSKRLGYREAEFTAQVDRLRKPN